MKSQARPNETFFQAFVRSEAFSGVLLVITAICAFAWANSAWSPAFASLAFGTSALLDQAKLGVLLASAAAAILGLGTLLLTLWPGSTTTRAGSAADGSEFR